MRGGDSRFLTTLILAFSLMGEGTWFPLPLGEVWGEGRTTRQGHFQYLNLSLKLVDYQARWELGIKKGGLGR